MVTQIGGPVRVQEHGDHVEPQAAVGDGVARRPGGREDAQAGELVGADGRGGRPGAQGRAGLDLDDDEGGRAPGHGLQGHQVELAAQAVVGAPVAVQDLPALVVEVPGCDVLAAPAYGRAIGGRDGPGSGAGGGCRGHGDHLRHQGALRGARGANDAVEPGGQGSHGQYCAALRHALGHTTTICDAAWPDYNEQYLIETTVRYAVSFNGKTRFNLELPADLDRASIERAALGHDAAAKWIGDKTPKKIIIVPNKIINIVL